MSKAMRGEALTAVRPGVHGLHEGDSRKCKRTDRHGGEHNPVPAQAY